MAELKVHDYEFREPLESQPMEHSEPTTEKLPTDPQRPEVTAYQHLRLVG